MVFLENRVVSEDRLKEGEQPIHSGLCPFYKTEVDAVCLTAVIHQTGVLEIAQASGNIGLRSTEDVLDVASAQLAAKEQVENPKSVLIGQSLEI